MNVTVDRDLCQGSGYCARSAGILFGLDAQGIVFLHGSAPDGPTTVPDDRVEDALAAARDCPAGAITVSEP